MVFLENHPDIIIYHVDPDSFWCKGQNQTETSLYTQTYWYTGPRKKMQKSGMRSDGSKSSNRVLVMPCDSLVFHSQTSTTFPISECGPCPLVFTTSLCQRGTEEAQKALGLTALWVPIYGSRKRENYLRFIREKPKKGFWLALFGSHTYPLV